MVEFALVLPLMLFLLAMAIDFGRLFYAYVAVENAAKEGAIYGAQNPICATDASASLCPDPQNVEWRVLNEAANLPGLQVTTIECRERASGIAYGDLRSCKDGDTYVVASTFDFQLITPILNDVLGTGLTLQSESQSKVLNEAFDPTPGAAVLKYACVDLGSGCTPIQTPTIDVHDQPVYVVATARETLRYRISVTNIGGQVLTGLTVTDSVPLPFGASGCPALPGSLARNATWTCEYTRQAPNPAVGQPFLLLSNTVEFDALEIDPVPQVAIVKVVPRPAELRVTKNVSPHKLGDDGDGVPRFGDTPTVGVYHPASGGPSVWFYLTVTNTGGIAATGVTVTDTFGALPVNADCPTVPATLDPGAQWSCRYRRTFASSETGAFQNRVEGTATNAPSDHAIATVTVFPYSLCTGTDRVVPNLIGLTFSQARTAWTAAGFTTALQPNGHNSSVVVTQNRMPYSCTARSTSGSMTMDPTP